MLKKDDKFFVKLSNEINFIKDCELGNNIDKYFYQNNVSDKTKRNGFIRACYLGNAYIANILFDFANQNDINRAYYNACIKNYESLLELLKPHTYLGLFDMEFIKYCTIDPDINIDIIGIYNKNINDTKIIIDAYIIAYCSIRFPIYRKEMKYIIDTLKPFVPISVYNDIFIKLCRETDYDALHINFDLLDQNTINKCFYETCFNNKPQIYRRLLYKVDQNTINKVYLDACVILNTDLINEFIIHTKF